jgi:hypothetical protein
MNRIVKLANDDEKRSLCVNNATMATGRSLCINNATMPTGRSLCINNATMATGVL